MIGVLYISDRTYLKTPSKSNIPEYPVGYHWYTGTDTGIKVKSTGHGTEGYGNGNSVSVNHVTSGCAHPQDSVLFQLNTMLECAKNVDKLLLFTADAYLIQVFTQWMPEWDKHAVKDNGRHIPHEPEWLRVKASNIIFCPIIEPSFGGNLVDIFSASRAEWCKEFTAPNLPVKCNAKHSELLWLGKLVFTPNMPIDSSNHLYTIRVSEALEIGNLDTSTVYGCVKLNSELPSIIKDICNAPFLDNVQHYLLTLSVLQNESSASLFKNYGVDVLGKPDVHTDRWTLGKSSRSIDVTVMESINPPYKLRKGLDIFNFLSTVLYKLQEETELALDDSFIKLYDVTPQLFPSGKLNPILTNGNPISITYMPGKKKKFSIGTELPDLLTLRRLLKASAQVYIGHVNANGVWRNIYVIKYVDGIGIYTTWLTNQLL